MTQITGQERRVVTLLGEGLSNKQVAESLGIAEKTVEIHLSNANRKLGTRTRHEAARPMKAMTTINPRSLREQILDALKGKTKPRTVSWITSCCTTRHESRVGPLIRQMVREGLLVEHSVNAKTWPGYTLREAG